MRPRTLDDLTGPYKVGRQITYRDCPACGRDTWKLYVDAESGLYKCFGCNAAGKLDMGRANVLATLYATRQAQLPKWAPMDLPPFQALSAEALSYLASKYGLDGAAAARYSLVEGAAGPYAGRILIPYLGYLGDVIYFNSRTYLGEVPKYKAAEGRHPLYVPSFSARTALPRFEAGLVLVEGAFDAIKVHLAGYRAVCIGGTALPRYLYPAVQFMAGRDPVRVVLDSDALDKGLQLMRRLQPFVRGEVTTVVLPPGQDPGSMTTDQLREVLQ